ncbi:peptidoglycan DD-metalloendopeptidase family protein [Streptomyces triticiradicis]|uniref:Peptidoglycan DD-metalloendopeptidase family protein n=1 Tax=Streptomyces triticiradicis TaxID=2651189 RepID=A0A7J5D935_9ACTN|nr:peptidoglycan DD-metalloendopeptidase family protein [Streptomyces triticiradicis]KAB1984187.1 peptidoglycan DD-metalloendopeptidase family protein [Streptomyces triticiradicis]
MSEVVLLSQVRPGAHNDSVLVVQKALAAAVGLDFSSGPGVFGRLTQDAYAKWQRHLGFSGAQADGVPGETSLKKLGDRFGFEVSLNGQQPPGGSGGHGVGARVASPVPGHHVTYPFGVKNARYVAGYHTGDDYAALVGTPVVAVRDGTIQWSNGNGGAYGNWIGLQAGNGRVYVYCHLSQRGVHPGQTVEAGQRIGKVGQSGNVTGPHLHFEDHPAGPFVYAHCRKPSW